MKISLFWNYFKKTLNWPLLKSYHLQCLVKGLANYFDEIRQDIILVRNQYIMPLGSVDLLEDYAASRGIKRLFTDTDETYRSRILNAYRWQKYAGRETGVTIILEEYGYPGAKITYPADKSQWAEFNVEFETYGQHPEGILTIINEFKPARSKLASITTPAATSGVYTLAGFSSISDRINSYKSSQVTVLTVTGYTKITDYIASYAY